MITANLVCQHEFDDRSVCAANAVPGLTRCAGHLDDGQPDVAVVEPIVAPVRTAPMAGAR